MWTCFVRCLGLSPDHLLGLPLQVRQPQQVHPRVIQGNQPQQVHPRVVQGNEVKLYERFMLRVRRADITNFNAGDVIEIVWSVGCYRI